MAQDDVDIRQIEAFLFHEARLLDDRQFEAWLDLFTDTGWYWVPVQPDQDNPYDTISLIYDDRRLLETRVRRLRNPRIHAQMPPSRTSHLIGNVTIEDDSPDDADLLVGSNFQMLEYRRDKQQVFGGSCRHGLIRTEDGFKIQWKRVNLANSDGMLDGISAIF
jgi:3-phenylpropionate/cinnamic acid dioxygenase small subunit